MSGLFSGLWKKCDRIVRYAGNGVLDMYGNWRAERYDVRNTIVVACTGRGGSTWLAQIIASLPRHHLLWEQLHWRTNPECQEYGFGKPLYLTSQRATKEQERYVRQILAGCTLPSAINTSQYFHPWKLLRLRAYVAKFVTANMLLPWLVDTFGVRTVFMLRHPCAVVASQMKHGRWDEVKKAFCEHPILFEEYPHLAQTFETIEGMEEVLAFNWAVQNFVPLASPKPRFWITTTYETLIDKGMDEVRRIFQELGEEVPQHAHTMFRRSSATARENVERKRNRKQLSKWRRRLSASQIEQILRIVHEVGIVCYTEALRPDLDGGLLTQKSREK